MIGALLVTTARSACAQDAVPLPVAPTVASLELAESEAEPQDIPTPITVIGTAKIQAAAPASLADVVNQIPSVAGSVTPANSQRQSSNGTAGVNTINLRSPGWSRTLILLDGHRSV